MLVFHTIVPLPSFLRCANAVNSFMNWYFAISMYCDSYMFPIFHLASVLLFREALVVPSLSRTAQNRFESYQIRILSPRAQRELCFLEILGPNCECFFFRIVVISILWGTSASES